MGVGVGVEVVTTDTDTDVGAKRKFPIDEDATEAPKSPKPSSFVEKDENKLATPKPSTTDETPQDEHKDEATTELLVALSKADRKGAGRAFVLVRKLLRSMGMYMENVNAMVEVVRVDAIVLRWLSWEFRVGCGYGLVWR